MAAVEEVVVAAEEVAEVEAPAKARGRAAVPAARPV